VERRIVEALRPAEAIGQTLRGRTPTLLILPLGLALTLKHLVALADERSEDL
jgi:hypothetical protein